MHPDAESGDLAKLEASSHASWVQCQPTNVVEESACERDACCLSSPGES